MSLIERLRAYVAAIVTEPETPQDLRVGKAMCANIMEEAASQLEAMQAEIERLRNFVEEIACSCIPDYEEAKSDAQTLLASLDKEGEK